MWSPLDEPTHIPEIKDMNALLRQYNLTPQALYVEYWARLQSIPAKLQMKLGARAFEFKCYLENWKIGVPLSNDIQENIKNELYLSLIHI